MSSTKAIDRRAGLALNANNINFNLKGGSCNYISKAEIKQIAGDFYFKKWQRQFESTAGRKPNDQEKSDKKRSIDYQVKTDALTVWDSDSSALAGEIWAQAKQNFDNDPSTKYEAFEVDQSAYIPRKGWQKCTEQCDQTGNFMTLATFIKEVYAQSNCK